MKQQVREGQTPLVARPRWLPLVRDTRLDWADQFRYFKRTMEKLGIVEPGPTSCAASPPPWSVGWSRRSCSN